jgi:hypothetical protein
MKNYRNKSLIALMALLSLGLRVAQPQEPPADKPPANVASKWTIYSKDPDGRTATKFVELKQDGTTLSGHFKGPNQSGGIEGTINAEHIMFRTKTRWVLTFRGRVQGDRIEGTWHDRKGTGEWQAVRETSNGK